MKKVRKLNRRGKLINSLNQGLDEKKELVAALMIKCDKTEKEVLEAYTEFYLQHENGFISKKEYTNSKGVNIYQLTFRMLYVFSSGIHESGSIVSSI